MSFRTVRVRIVLIGPRDGLASLFDSSSHKLVAMRGTIFYRISEEIPVGGSFEYRGRRYLKLALSMACDEDRIGNIFHVQTEVLPDPLPQQPSPENPGSPLLHQQTGDRGVAEQER